MSVSFPKITSDSLAVAMNNELGFQHNSPIRCIGGKAKQVKYLATLMPARMEHFYEPFGGGLSMTFFLIKTGRVKGSMCYAGDVHEPQVNFFQVLQSEYEALTLMLCETRLEYGDGTREIFNKAVDQINTPESPLMQAWGLYVFNNLGMLGIREYKHRSYIAPTKKSRGGLKLPQILRLPFFGELLQGASIQKQSYSKALEDAAKHNGFVFLDPPYEGFDDILYDVKFDFDEFAERCHAVTDKCSFMITINDSPRNRERFKGYQIFLRDVNYGMSKKTVQELVICNDKLDAQGNYLDQLGYQTAA
jgi:site-specific DNA-adenine methylase